MKSEKKKTPQNLPGIKKGATDMLFAITAFLIIAAQMYFTRDAGYTALPSSESAYDYR